MRLFLTSEVIFSLVRLFLKNSLKRFFGLGIGWGAEWVRALLRPPHPKDPAILKDYAVVNFLCVVNLLGGRFGYFYFFQPGGGGVRGDREGEGGPVAFIENRRRGRGLPQGAWGCEGPGGCLQRIWGGA